jgi:ribosomal-protein-alanine N-acetyltransferase
MTTILGKPSAFANLRLEGEKVLLKPFTLDLVTERYLGWIRDPKTTEFIWKAGPDYSLKDLRAFGAGMMESEGDLFFAIHDRNGAGHVGNLRLGPIDWRKRVSGFGILIGEATKRGVGYGAEAIDLATRYAVTELGLDAVRFEVVADNIPAMRVYEKLGFRNLGKTPNLFEKNGRSFELVAFERRRA